MTIGSWFLGVDCCSVVGVAHVLGSCWLLPASICKKHRSPLFFRHVHVDLVVGVAGAGAVAVLVLVVVVVVACVALAVAVVLHLVLLLVACWWLIAVCCFLLGLVVGVWVVDLLLLL